MDKHEQLPLSKWWTTSSAKAAMRRAEMARRERIEKVRAQFKAKQDALKKAVEEWEVK